MVVAKQGAYLPTRVVPQFIGKKGLALTALTAPRASGAAGDARSGRSGRYGCALRERSEPKTSLPMLELRTK